MDIEFDMEKDLQKIERVLADAGIDQGLSEIEKTGASADAVPSLIRILREGIVAPNLQSAIIKGLTSSLASGHVAPGTLAGLLIELFRKSLSSASTSKAGMHAAWGIASAICSVAKDSNFDDLIELVMDRRYGRAREMLAVALGNTRDPRNVEVLMKCLGDDEVAGHALIALKKLAPQRAEQAIENFLQHPKPWVRSEAAKALNRIRKQGRGKASGDVAKHEKKAD